MKIVVTGASGNVGTSLLRLLGADDRVDEITGVARRRPAWALPKVRWVAADVANHDLTSQLQGAAAVIHLAWTIQPSRDVAAMHRVNVGGSARVWAAAARAGVPTIVHASSVGAYSPRTGLGPVDEQWPTDGIPTSGYSRQKAYVERQLDAFEVAHPDRRVVRLRPGLIFKGEAATEIHRNFLGRLVPRGLLRADRIPVLPDDGLVRFQAVHADDVAAAYTAALHSDVRGAVNVATDEVFDLPAVAELLGARTVRIPPTLLRAAAAATFRARLHPTPPGWVDLAQQVPVMDTGRARHGMGWTATRRAADALRELLTGLHEGQRGPTSPLQDGPPG